MSAEATGNAWRTSPYRGDTLLVHLAVADVVNDVHDYRLWMLRDALARKAKVSRGTVDRALRQMVGDGWLTVLVKGGGRGNPTEYRYNLSGEPRQGDAVSGETASTTSETASPCATSSSLTNSRTQDPPPASTATADGPSTIAWRLAKDRIARGNLVDRGPRNLARAVQSALDVPYPEDVVEEALAGIEGVPIAAGNLTVECSRILSARTADVAADERDGARDARWWDRQDGTEAGRW